MDRREFLKTGGVLAAVAATGGCWYSYDHGVFSTATGDAFSAWEHWQAANGQQTLPLVRAAILAANPHNTQPWRFELTDATVALHIDRSRNVGNLDPYLREEYLGMGCALENLMLAASARGYSASAILSRGSLTGPAPKMNLEPVARVVVKAGPREESDLYRAIPRRHTNRGPYDAVRPLPSGFLDALSQLPGADDSVKVFLFSDSGQRENIAGLSSVANETLYSDPDVEAASERWIRLEWKQVQMQRDGLSIDAFGLPPLTAAFLKTLPAPLLRPLVARGQRTGYKERMLTAPLMGFIAVRDRYDVTQTLNAGRIWQRAHLLATHHGIAARPSNESVELIDYERFMGRPQHALDRLTAVIGDAGWQPTFAFLMGYPTLACTASPDVTQSRWSFRDKQERVGGDQHGVLPHFAHFGGTAGERH